MKSTTALAFLSLALCCISAAYADTFGSGSNLFDIEFVTIGNPGNAADITGDPNPAGSVSYVYRIGEFEISRDMIDKARASGGPDLGSSHSTGLPSGPAMEVNWFEAATVINWLNTSTGSTPAYKLGGTELWTPSDVGYNPANPYRNSLAKYFLPSLDEWYKAAYYDSTSDIYYEYPTSSDTAPTAVSSGAGTNTAVFGQPIGTFPADITLAGALSPYGTMGQGGNVLEWVETEFDLVNDSPSSNRGARGGTWQGTSSELSSSAWSSFSPSFGNIHNGFRVASVIPEPNTLLLGALGAVGVIYPSRKQKTARFS